ncbi:MAG TPA: HEAT repeat domain-containing protein, partial [Longimicrobiales bacterium]|nr:HEAT repeat domain-containing protein [Longimicrobiales bacterium]
VMLAGSMVVASGVAVGELGALHAPSLASPLVRPVLQAPQQDPASALYREAREALSRDDLAAAAARFERIRSEHPSSMYVPDSYYWQAFALYREGSRSSLQAAQRLLRMQASDHASASTRADASSLLVQVDARLAGRGDAQAAASVAQQAAAPCDGNDDVRLAALSALMNMNAERALPILQELLRDRDACSAELREQAVFIIAQSRGDEAVDILLDLAHRNPDPDPDVREQAVFWLHQVRTPEALAALRAILEESDDEDLQEQAIFAISQRPNDAAAMQVLRDYAERADGPAELRQKAIFWIGQTGGTAYLQELYGRLTDPELREAAIFGIAQGRGAESRAWLLELARSASEPVEVREEALFWAGQSGGLTVAELRTFYDAAQEPEMKEQAIFVASQSRGPEMVDFLMEVAESDDDPEMREQAVFWLGQSNDPRVPEFLLGLIRR